MKKLQITTSIFALTLISVIMLVPKAGLAKQVDNHPAISGYDLVSYFTQNRAEAGSAKHNHRYNGKTYWFTSAANKAVFIQNPENYLPQYDGYCAFGVMYGEKIEASPEAWAIVNGKLYLNTDRSFLEKWKKDTTASIKAGDEQWSLMKD